MSTLLRILALAAVAAAVANAQCCIPPPAPPVDPVLQAPPNLGTGPQLVLLSVNFISCEKIDGVEQIFNADLYLSAYWYDPRLNGSYDPTLNFNPRMEFINQGSDGVEAIYDDSTAYTYPFDVASVADWQGKAPSSANWVSYQQRYIGTFSTPLDLHNFPFDKQVAQVVVESTLWTAKQMKFVPATSTFDDTMLPDGFKIDEFDILSTSHNEKGHFYPSFNEYYSSFTFSINVQRQPQYYMYKFVSGSCLLFYMSCFIFMLETHEADRMMGTITCFLAMVNFVFISIGNTPAVAYNSKIDNFFLACFILIFVQYACHFAFYPFRPEEEKEEKKCACDNCKAERKKKEAEDEESKKSPAGNARSSVIHEMNKAMGHFNDSHATRQCSGVTALMTAVLFAIAAGVTLHH